MERYFKINIHKGSDVYKKLIEDNEVIERPKNKINKTTSSTQIKLGSYEFGLNLKKQNEREVKCKK